MTPRTHALLAWLLATLAACAEGVTDTAPVAETSPTKPSRPATAPDAAAVPDVDADAAASADEDAAADADAVAVPDAAGPPDAGPDAPSVPMPTVDGTLSPGEYGTADNQLAGATTTWLMTWDDDKLYVGVSGANVAEGVVLYLDTAPLAPSTSGSNADGSIAGTPYDGTRALALPFRADFVAYVKSTYQEHRAADGANGWGGPVTSGITVAGAGSTREIAIPWSTVRAGGRPSSFGWLAYATSAGGYVYGQMPASNPGGNVGTSATFAAFYKVADATQRKPFAAIATP